MQLGTQLQPDAPLSQSIDQYQSWISAQMGRVNSRRETLGPEFVQELVVRYQNYQKEVTKEREAVANHASAIDHALRELTMAEMRAAELLVAEDAGAATKELVSCARRDRRNDRGDTQQPPEARQRRRLIRLR